MTKQIANIAKVEPRHVRGLFQANTLDAAERTVEIVFATDTPVRMYDYNSGRYVDEVLSFEADHLDLTRLDGGGAQVLDNHQRYGSVRDAILGVVEKAWVQDGQGRAKIRFSKRPEVDGIWNDVENGILRSFSVGYNVYRYQVEEPEIGTKAVPVYRAVRWQPYEISPVTVAADPVAGVRSASNLPQTLNDVEMTVVSKQPQTEGGTTQTRGAQGGADNPTGGQRSADDGGADDGDGEPSTQTRGAQGGRSNGGGSQGGNFDAAQAERKRGQDIRSAVRAARLPESFADTLIDNGTSVDQARAAIIDEFAKSDPHNGGGAQGGGQRAQGGSSQGAQGGGQRGQILVGRDAAERFRDDAANTLLIRSGAGNGGHVKLTADERKSGESLRGMNLLRMAEECLTIEGVNTRSMSRREIATAALGLGRSMGAHTTTDFPLLLGTAIRRSLTAAYEFKAPTFTAWARRGTLNDFRPEKRVNLSGLIGNFERVAESGEYKSATVTEGGETVQLFKYGRKISVSWESIVNDDLGAFNRLPVAIAEKSRQLQSNLVYKVLSDNAALSDTKALFHTDHKNLAAAGGAINLANVGAAVKAFREQTDPNGDVINVDPRFLIVGPAKEVEARQFVAVNYQPAKQSDINVFQNELTVIVESRISGNTWYLAAEPMAIDTVEYNFLEGEPDLFTEERMNFETDSFEIKARTVFGTSALDFRGLYKNPGA